VPAITGVSHLGLTVRNLDTSEGWYRRVFDLEQVHRERGDKVDSVVLRHPASGMVVSLHRHHGAGTARFDETRTGLDHVSFGVADRDELARWEDHLRHLGVVHSETTETPFGWVLVLRDPDHVQLELFCRGEEPKGGSGGA
jgi:catechol-2,3-dioxygenase